MSDSTLYLYTSLTAGSSHIVTATARVETILKANKLPFRAIDVATDDAARKLWGRRSRGKKLPGLVKYGDIVGDLEQIEEWNEFGELRMVVNSVQDLGGLPATSNPISPPADSNPASTPKEPEPGTPKPSTIKIQSPPAKTEEKKDDKAVLALRQASEEAASKAKSKADDKKQPSPPKEESESKKADEDSTSNAKTRHGSVAAELPDTAGDSPKGVKRPPLVPEVAAVSSANFHADNAETLGLVEHHRGSIISTTDKEEQEKVVSDIRQSITGEDAGGLDAVRKEAANKAQENSIEEEPSPSDEKVETTGTTEAKDATETKKATEPKEEPEDTNSSKDEATKTPAKEEATATQDPKSAEAATESVKD
ncbi:hypothetical protein N7492_001540 [Penicillium capsulatum]|uniref:Uncharacterized protein n=1 Tax=Penicillium capsulatum TaxID=69766 RepID=A0A9W9M0E4_9EURO|nr:hypothetical protein N7492_001540 [Penicillium capsulatum]KAJ6129407.1 hypothetical protein N7512_002187 [Penicillium capsulatum]